MNVQAGERYRCSDSNCGCEIEITTPSAVQDDSEEFGIGSPNDRSIVGSLSAKEAGSLHHAETSAICTPGDYGSLGATGEGLFGTSGGTQLATASGRLGSTSVTDSRSNSSNTSDIESGSTGQVTFSCCCGRPMRKSSSRGDSSSRVMA